MKTLVKTTVAASAIALSASVALADGKVVVYNWFEYIPQELVDKFTAETGIDVVMDTYDSKESMLASLKAGGIGTYDVSLPGDYMVKIMANEGLLDTIAEGELANKGNIEAQWLDVDFDPGRKHSIPYQWGSTAFAVNRDVYQGDINTTDILFNPPAELRGKVNMLDSQGEVLAMASLHRCIVASLHRCIVASRHSAVLNRPGPVEGIGRDAAGGQNLLGILQFRYRERSVGRR